MSIIMEMGTVRHQFHALKIEGSANILCSLAHTRTKQATEGERKRVYPDLATIVEQSTV